MGLLRKLKKTVKGVAKLAIKTAPIWSQFVPMGGMAMTVLRSAMKTPTPSPAAKNRFPLPNPYYQGGATVQAAYDLHAQSPYVARGGPYRAIAGRHLRMRKRAVTTVRRRALRAQRMHRAAMQRMAM